MRVYYNEFDKKKCSALKQLIADGHIAKGEIDDRSIKDVQPGDLKGFTRCHFFAGIGLWEYALQLAGWPDDRPVWTGSCPCQPYSTAGRQKAQADDRHLWPEWLRLIRERKPATIFGEQVANAITHGWLDDVYQGLECEGYAVGSAVLPATSVGAPHRRERLLFIGESTVGNATGLRCDERREAAPVAIQGDSTERSGEHQGPEQVGKLPRRPEGLGGDGCTVAQPTSNRPHNEAHEQVLEGKGGSQFYARESGAYTGNVADSKRQRPQGQGELPGPLYTEASGEGEADKPVDDCTGHWESGVWIGCPDGKARLVEPGIPLLANGYPERVGIIHCAGDAIVPQVAAEFIKAAGVY